MITPVLRPCTTVTTSYKMAVVEKLVGLSVINSFVYVLTPSNIPREKGVYHMNSHVLEHFILGSLLVKDAREFKVVF